MKKVMIAVAMVMSLGTAAAFAGNLNVNSTIVCMAADEETPVEVKDLPAAVQEALKKNYPEATAKQASVVTKEDGTKVYKVVLADKEGKESTVTLKENGEAAE